MALQRPEAPAFVREMLGADPKHLRAFVGAFWPHLVGSDVAARTRIVSAERAGTLVVEVPDASWRRELYRLQVTVLIRLREALGPAAPRKLGFMEVRNFRPTPKDPIDLGATQRRPAVPAPAVLDAAKSISSAELRAAFIQTATTYLSAFGAGGRSRTPTFARGSAKREALDDDAERESGHSHEPTPPSAPGETK